jgi:hypothetical protein
MGAGEAGQFVRITAAAAAASAYAAAFVAPAAAPPPPTTTTPSCCPQIEDRPVVRERVERIVEHRPVEKEYVTEVR